MTLKKIDSSSDYELYMFAAIFLTLIINIYYNSNIPQNLKPAFIVVMFGIFISLYILLELRKIKKHIDSSSNK